MKLFPYLFSFMLALLVLKVSLVAQNYNDYKIPNFIPKVQDANVSNLLGQIDFPVSLNTGVVNVSVPITSISAGNFNLNVSLNYVNGNGIGARQESGSFGLGWNLTAGGVLTRQISGSNDCGLRGYKQNKIADVKDGTIKLAPESAGEQSLLWDLTGTNGTTPWDLSPDYFSFSAPSISGGFYLDYTNDDRPIMQPASNLKVVSSGTNEWTVTDLQGNQFVFGGAGYYIMSNNSNIFFDPTETSLNQIDYYLKKIVTFLGEEITYSYSANTEYTRTYLKNEVQTIDNSAVTVQPNFSGHSKVFNKRISEISFPSGKLQFNLSSNTREDLANTTMKIEESIVLKGKDGSIIKSWFFDFDYFNPSSTSNLLLRLKLTALSIKGNDGTEEGVYKFQYNNTPLPSKNAYNIDHWGYPNGATNSTLIPTTTVTLPSGNPHRVNGANRESMWNGGMAGILKSVEYPTGGTTNFVYESNTIHEPYFEPIPEIITEISEYSLSNNSFQYSITIDYDQLISYSSSNINLGGVDPPSSNVTITSSGGGSSIVLMQNVTDHFIYLPSGNYAVNVNVDPNTKNVLIIKKVNNGPYRENKPIGGVRIKTITHNNDIDPTKNIQKHITYNDFAATNHSSGILINPHQRDYKFTSFYTVYPTGAACSPGAEPHNVVTVSSSAMGNVIPSVSYANVTETIGSNKGYTQYTYTTTPNDGGVSQGPTVSNAHKRGLLLKTEVFDNTNFKLKKTENSFQFSFHDKTLFGMMIRTTVPYSKCLIGGTIPQWLESFQTVSSMTADLKSEWVKLVQTKTTSYDINGTSHIETKNTYYHNVSSPVVPLHYQPIRVRTQLSNQNKAWEVSTTNAFDYKNISNGNTSVQSLLDANIYSPIEIIKREVTNPGASETTKVLNAFFTNYLNKLPYQIYTSKNTEPITSFTPASFSSGASFTIDASYSLDSEFTSYSNTGNLEEYNQIEGEKNAIIWGYNKQYPIAMVGNASRKEVAYSSFEAQITSTSSWSIPSSTSLADFKGWNLNNCITDETIRFTGKYAAKINQLKGPETSIIGLEQNTVCFYKVSAWVNTNSVNVNGKLKVYVFKESLHTNPNNPPPIFSSTYVKEINISNTNGEWKYIELTIASPGVLAADEWGLHIQFFNNSANPSTNIIRIDEVRISPADAIMQTTTYEFPFGKTSDCDNRNNRINYEYDQFGRLKLIRDHNNNILKSVEYHYK